MLAYTKNVMSVVEEVISAFRPEVDRIVLHFAPRYDANGGGVGSLYADIGNRTCQSCRMMGPVSDEDDETSQSS